MTISTGMTVIATSEATVPSGRVHRLAHSRRHFLKALCLFLWSSIGYRASRCNAASHADRLAHLTGARRRCRPSLCLTLLPGIPRVSIMKKPELVRQSWSCTSSPPIMPVGSRSCVISRGPRGVPEAGTMASFRRVGSIRAVKGPGPRQARATGLPKL
jgi:hypothetical protein